MATGTVKWFNAQKGFALIQPERGSKEIFVQLSAIERSARGNLQPGQTVSYDTEEDLDARGPV